MKISKILAAGLFATAIATAQEANTQKPGAGVGIRAAFNYNMMYGLSDEWNVYAEEDDDTPAGIGFEGGLVARLQLLPFLQFTPEVLFNYTNLKQDDGDTDREFKQMGIEIPVLLRVTPIDKIYLAIGPTFEFNISDEEHLNSGDMEVLGEKYHHEYPEGYDRNTLQFGLTMGFGYYIVNRVSVDVRLNLGLSEVYEGKLLYDKDGNPKMDPLTGEQAKGSQLIDLSDGKQMTIKFGLGFWII